MTKGYYGRRNSYVWSLQPKKLKGEGEHARGREILNLIDLIFQCLILNLIDLIFQSINVFKVSGIP